MSMSLAAFRRMSLSVEKSETLMWQLKQSTLEDRERESPRKEGVGNSSCKVIA